MLGENAFPQYGASGTIPGKAAVNLHFSQFPIRQETFPGYPQLSHTPNHQRSARIDKFIIQPIQMIAKGFKSFENSKARSKPASKNDTRGHKNSGRSFCFS